MPAQGETRPGQRIDTLVLVLGVAAWAGVFIASAQGRLGVSWKVSDSLLALLGIVIAHRVWRIGCRWSRPHA